MLKSRAHGWSQQQSSQTSNFFLWRLTNRVSSKCVYFLIQSSLRNCHLSYVGHYLSFLVSLTLSSVMYYANHQQKSTGINHSAQAKIKFVYFLIQSSLRNCHLSYLSFLVSLPLSSAMFYANHQQKSTGINHSAQAKISFFMKSRRGQWSPRELSEFWRCFFGKRRISQCSSNIIGLLKVLAPNNVLWSERFWGCLSKFQTFLLTKIQVSMVTQ